MDRDHAIVTLQLPEARSDGVEGLWKNSKIAVRSNRDRGAIEPRSWSICCGINPQGPDVIFVRMCSEIDAQSMHDQATIVVDRGRSRRKAWPRGNGIHGEIKANSWPISKRQRRPKESLPLPIKPPPRSPSIGHDLRGNFFFKNPCISSFVLQLLIDS